MESFSATVQVRYASPEEARLAFQAIHPDDESGIRTTQEGSTVQIHGSSRTPSGLLRGLDDALGCLRALQHPTPLDITRDEPRFRALKPS